MKKFTSLGSGSSSRKKAEKASRAAAEAGRGQAVDGGYSLDSSALNELEMLRVENAHLKRLIEQQNEAQGDDGASAAEIARVRRERDELQMKLSKLQAEYDTLQRDYANLQRDRRIEVDERHSETRTVEAQIEFMSQQHQQELQEKESRIRELEMKLVDLEQEVELAQSPAHFIQARSLDFDEMKDRVADLEKRLQVAKADNQRRAEEADRLREELEAAKAKGADEGVVAAAKAERDYFKAQLEARDAKARNYQEKSDELEQQTQMLSEELHRKQEIISSLESQISDLRMRDSGGVREAEGGAAEGLPADIRQLQQLVKEKEQAVWHLSDRLLAISSEKDALEQSNRQLKAELESTQVSAPQPPTPSGKKSKKVCEESHQQVQTQLAQAQTQLAALREEKDSRERQSQSRISELERKSGDFERQAKRSEERVHDLERDRDRLEALLKKKDAEIEALEVSKEYQVKALAVARTVTLPVHHEKSEGDTQAGSSLTAEDLRIELALKSAALRALSVKNAHLNDVLQRLRLASSTETTERELEEAQRSLHATSTELRLVEGNLKKLQEEKTKLQARLARVETELEVWRKDAQTARAALAEAQTRNARTADQYKVQSDRYSSMLARAMADTERLQQELTKERSARREAGKAFRKELRALRASKARRLDFEDVDPLHPLPLPSGGAPAQEADALLHSEPKAEGEVKQASGVDTAGILVPAAMVYSSRSEPPHAAGGCAGGHSADASGVYTLQSAPSGGVSPVAAAASAAPIYASSSAVPSSSESVRVYGVPAAVSTGVLPSEVYVHRLDGRTEKYLTDDEVYYVLGEDGAVRCVPRIKRAPGDDDGDGEKDASAPKVSEEDQRLAARILRQYVAEAEEERRTRSETGGDASASHRTDSAASAGGRATAERQRDRRENDGCRSPVNEASRDDESDVSVPRLSWAKETREGRGNVHRAAVVSRSSLDSPLHGFRGADTPSYGFGDSAREDPFDMERSLFTDLPSIAHAHNKLSSHQPLSKEQTAFSLSPEGSRLISTASDASAPGFSEGRDRRRPQGPSAVPCRALDSLLSLDELFPSRRALRLPDAARGPHADTGGGSGDAGGDAAWRAEAERADESPRGDDGSCPLDGEEESPPGASEQTESRENEDNVPKNGATRGTEGGAKLRRVSSPPEPSSHGSVSRFVEHLHSVEAKGKSLFGERRIATAPEAARGVMLRPKPDGEETLEAETHDEVDLS
ncbi:hypothetical protein BESB_074470 [Besnoitia besnoiti]|uniref:Uncharacterized protein n=1 Tax=Besnoitia besnoiti TaxID=94643 RepID=A0A2A9M8I5_BESBE|nr:uncharacterized protein BESB_074470 [Besnoitia besnoiti]PFH34295.1 hypothetical protein BESB_074470 [Besnoitia besnoiti]